MIRITWTDRKGTGRMRAFERGDYAIPFLETLRRPATVTDSSGEIVGEVELIPVGLRKGRRKWGWWIDGEAR